MCFARRISMMIDMNNQLTASKVLLVADRPAWTARAESAPVRRYRLARLQLEGRALPPRARPSALRRAHG
jgi:hypothetical protein